MDMSEILKKAKVFAPLLSVVLIAACVAGSLSGYEAPIYGAQEESADSTEQEAVAASEEVEAVTEETEETEESVEATGTFDLKDGVYRGTGTGFAGDITVAVQIKSGQITSIDVVSTSDDAAFFNRAKAVLDSMIEKQTYNVDTVSGATFSSKGLINAVKNALTGTKSSGTATTKKAFTGEKGTFEVADGVYEGEGIGFGGITRVSVTVSGQQITAINILSQSDDASFFNRAKAVIDEIMEAQTLDVDTVSGATFSSRGIINAVKNALTGVQDTSEAGNVHSGAQAASGSSSTISKVDETAAAYKDGVYEGTGTGFGGEMKVQVTIRGGKIAAIEILENKDGSSYIEKASALIDTIISKQSTNVDTVSGASYSSAGIIQAVRNALEKASGSADDAASDGKDDQETITGTVPYKEGIYYGTAEGYSGDVSVAVVIQDQTIKAILVTETSDDEAFFSRAMDVVKNVVKKQNTEVDTVSGATYSSEGLLNAIKNALAQAKKVTNGESIEEKPDTAKLTEAVASAEQLTESDYTELSWAILQIRLEDAKEALEESDQKIIDKALEKLNRAVLALVKKDTGDDSGDDADSVYIDGTYAVSVLCEPDEDGDFEAYNLSMNVTIQKDKIVAITDVTGDGDKKNDRYIRNAANGTSTKEGMISQIVNKGLPEEVDAVSGATCSSNAIMEGCRQALEKAKRPEKTEAAEQ